MINLLLIAINVVCLISSTYALQPDIIKYAKTYGVISIMNPNYDVLSQKPKTVDETIGQLKLMISELDASLKLEKENNAEKDIEHIDYWVLQCNKILSNCDTKLKEGLNIFELNKDLSIELRNEFFSITTYQFVHGGLGYMLDYLSSIWLNIKNIFLYEENGGVTNVIIFPRNILNTSQFISKLYKDHSNCFKVDENNVVLYGGTVAGKKFFARCILDELGVYNFTDRNLVRGFQTSKEETKNNEQPILEPNFSRLKSDYRVIIQKNGTTNCGYYVYTSPCAYIFVGADTSENDSRSIAAYVANWLFSYSITHSLIYNMLFDYLDGYNVSFNTQAK